MLAAFPAKKLKEDNKNVILLGSVNRREVLSWSPQEDWMLAASPSTPHLLFCPETHPPTQEIHVITLTNTFDNFDKCLCQLGQIMLTAHRLIADLPKDSSTHPHLFLGPCSFFPGFFTVSPVCVRGCAIPNIY